MKWNYQKLRGKIIEVCGTQEEFAKKIGIGRVSLSKRMTGQIDFSQQEIFMACSVLGIELNNISEYFFCA